MNSKQLSNALVVLLIVAVVAAAGAHYYLKTMRVAPMTNEVETKMPSEPTDKKSEPVSMTAEAGVTYLAPKTYEMHVNSTLPGITKQIRFVAPENSRGGEKDGPASIIVEYYPNPAALSAEQWAKTKGVDMGYGAEGEGAKITTYPFLGRTGVRFSPPDAYGLFLEDRVVVAYRDSILVFANFNNDRDNAQSKAFETMLATVRFE